MAKVLVTKIVLAFLIIGANCVKTERPELANGSKEQCQNCSKAVSFIFTAKKYLTWNIVLFRNILWNRNVVVMVTNALFFT